MSNYRDEYERTMKTNSPEIATAILVTLCRERDKRIAELKTEIQGMMVKKEFESEKA